MSSERQENKNNPWWGEHIHRYEQVTRYIQPPGRILDLACGSGFGSHFLAKKGFQVTGGDISSAAIEISRSAFSDPNLEFKEINATRIPYADEYFDAVVSFETIEHTTEFLEVLKEFRRVCKKGGIIIISTPNFLVNSPGGNIINPYHTQEWTYEQLKKLLEDVFSNVELLGQHYSRYDNRQGMRFKIGKFIEKVLYLRGIRKIPIKIQDHLMKIVAGLPMYPTEKDYSLVNGPEKIKLCKTFFAVCKP